MSVLSEGLASALSAIANASGASLEYATSSGGAFTALVGFVIHQDLVGDPTYDSSDRVVAQARRGFLKGPLTPALALGYRIKDLTQTPNITWAVEGVMFEGQQIAALSRQERVGVAGPDRGASA